MPNQIIRENVILDGALDGSVTADTIRALRTAPSMCLDLLHDDDPSSPTFGSMVSQFRIPASVLPAMTAPSGSTEPDTCVRVPTTLTDYGDSYGDTHVLRGYAYLVAPQYDPLIVTALRAIKPSTRVGLRWTRSNNNVPMRTAGLHLDSVDLRVTDRDNQTSVYRLATSVSLDNSARMIRAVRLG